MRDNVRIVLVEPSHSGNVGAVARAMKNMGLRDLILVSPRCGIDDVAVRRASGATDILDHVRTCVSLDEALSDCVHVFGASSRKRRIGWPLMSARESADKASKIDGVVAFVFGREDRGLDNDELSRCNTHLYIPADEEYASLNLAMAVQVVSYELRMSWLAGEAEQASRTPSEGTSGVMEDWDDEPATWEEVNAFYQHLEETLVAIDYLDRDNPRKLMPRLKRLYSRAQPGKTEINILRGICKATLKKARIDANIVTRPVSDEKNLPIRG